MKSTKFTTIASSVPNEILLFLLFVVSGFSVLMILLLLRRFNSFSKQLNQQLSVQNEHSMQLLHKLQNSNELSDKYHQQLQQQLNFNISNWLNSSRILKVLLNSKYPTLR